MQHTNLYVTPEPWNKGKLIGQKSPLKPQQVWAIRARLQIADHKRDLALLNLAIDSKLRGCDLLNLKVSDLQSGGDIRHRGQSVQFEITEQTRIALQDWIKFKALQAYDWVFPSRKKQKQ